MLLCAFDTVVNHDAGLGAKREYISLALNLQPHSLAFVRCALSFRYTNSMILQIDLAH